MERNLSNPAIEYLNARILCKLAPSKVHGIGVIAIKDIKKGDIITDSFRGVKTVPMTYSFIVEEFLMLDESVQNLILDKTMFNKNSPVFNFISPNDEAYLLDFLNHSDTPNVSCYGFALRDIKAGEELFEDFRQLDNNPHQLVVDRLKGVCKF